MKDYIISDPSDEQEHIYNAKIIKLMQRDLDRDGIEND
jgi:hypothetical protein